METNFTHGHHNVITWWESEDNTVMVEIRHHRGAFLVRTLRAGQVSAQEPASTETRARTIFERTVEKLVEEN